MSHIKLGYWNIRGLAEPIRLLLNHCGEPFEDIRYQQGPKPDLSREAWYSVKHTLGLDFPNIPFYIDDEIKLTESIAIMMHIAARHDLLGDSTTMMIMGVTDDFRKGFTRLCYSSDYDDDRCVVYRQGVLPKLKLYSDFLAEKEFICGNLSFADFALAEILDQHLLWDKTILDEFPNLQGYLARFFSLPAVADYRASNQFQERPCNNESASWK